MNKELGKIRDNLGIQGRATDYRISASYYMADERVLIKYRASNHKAEITDEVRRNLLFPFENTTMKKKIFLYHQKKKKFFSILFFFSIKMHFSILFLT